MNFELFVGFQLLCLLHTLPWAAAHVSRNARAADLKNNILIIRHYWRKNLEAYFNTFVDDYNNLTNLNLAFS